MSPLESNRATVLGINLQLAGGSLCGIGAWALWPQTAEWWGFGVMSVMLGMGALAGVSNAMRAAFTLHAKERVIAEYVAQGAKPKSSQMASDEQLRKAGMLG